MSNITSNPECGNQCETGAMECLPFAEEDKNVCWICLDGDSPSRPLVQPCKCPRFCHSRCLARWQLQSAGTRRESQCDFCNGKLPDWRQVLSFHPSDLTAPAIMNVNFEGKTYSFEVKPGSSGYLQFTEAIRQAFQLPADSELNITFTCDEPCTEAGSLLTLQGPGAYDAAVYCASISAARRQLGQRSRSQSISGGHEVITTDNNRAMVNGDQSESQGYTRTRHYRSRTAIGTGFRPIFRPEEFLTPRRRHNRARSLVSLSNSSNTTSSASDSIRGSNNEQTTRPSKGWAKVAKKMKAIYNKIRQK